MAKKRRDGDDDDSDLTPLARVMRSEKRPHVIVMFPKLNVPVAIVNPSDEEVAESAAAATQFLKQELRLDEFQLSLMLDRNLYENEEARQLLSRVLRDPADIDASFATVDELREHLTADVRKILMRHLAGFIATQDPEPKEKDGRDDAAFRGFIEDLKDEGGLVRISDVLRYRYAATHRHLTGRSVAEATKSQLYGYLQLEFAEQFHFGPRVEEPDE
jgi:hypothetical protein